MEWQPQCHPPLCHTGWAQSPGIVRGLRLFLVPPVPHSEELCQARVTLVTHRVWLCPCCPWVPGRWGRTFSWGCCAGAAGGCHLPQVQLWREDISNVPCTASQGWLGRAELFGGADEIGERAFPAGKGDLQRWALHWHLEQGWGQVALLPVTPGSSENPSNPRESQQSQEIPGISAHTGTNRCQGGLDPCRTPMRSGHPQSCPGWSP